MKKLTRYTSCIFMIFLIALPLHGQSSSDAYRTEIFQTSGTPEVEISTGGGFIDVVGTDGTEVIVEMFVKKGSRYVHPEDEDLSDYLIDIGQTGNTVFAVSESKESLIWRWGKSSFSISFRVSVPKQAIVDGRTSGGRVSAEYLRNRVALRTSGGSVRVVDVQGDVALRTSGGSITLGNVAGNIQARTSGGSIQAEVLAGDADLRTSGGSIRLHDISAGLRARTSGGGITADVTRFEENIDLRTSGGSINVTLPATDHFALDLKGSRVRTELRNFSGTSERNSIEGMIGRGGPLLTARTSGGSVSVDY